MESPATWKHAEQTICEAYQEWAHMMSMGAVGPSLPKLIADRLRQEGLIQDADEPELGWQR